MQNQLCRPDLFTLLGQSTQMYKKLEFARDGSLTLLKHPGEECYSIGMAFNRDSWYIFLSCGLDGELQQASAKFNSINAHILMLGHNKAGIQNSAMKKISILYLIAYINKKPGLIS